jgi:hypothetical protein
MHLASICTLKNELPGSQETLVTIHQSKQIYISEERNFYITAKRTSKVMQVISTKMNKKVGQPSGDQLLEAERINYIFVNHSQFRFIAVRVHLS